MLVDRDASRAGGRAIRNLPEELASFDWSGDPPRSVVVCDPDGEVVMSARWSQGPPVAAAARPGAVLGTVDGDALAGRLIGLARGGPARVSVTVPTNSHLHDLGVAGRRPRLVGHVDLLAAGRRPSRQR